MKILIRWGHINLSFNNYLEYFSHGRNFYSGNPLFKSDPRRFESGIPVSQDSRARGGVGLGLGDWETGRLGDWETGRLGDWETLASIFIIHPLPSTLHPLPSTLEIKSDTRN